MDEGHDSTSGGSPSPPPPPPAGATLARFGAVSYLNTLPLIEGLAKLEGVTLHLTAPASLIDLLRSDVADVALVSSIDYQRSQTPLAILPVGAIGSHGPTMTVRLFSRRPIEEVNEVHADVDSHTSIALLTVVLHERFGVSPCLQHFDADQHRAARGDAAAAGENAPWPDALLLIGDKVVTDSPPAALYPHQLDLGLAWKELTGLPFVYAAWMCKAERAGDPAMATAAALLDRQRRHNATRLGWIAATAAPRRGWPTDLATRYLTELLRYDFDTPAAQALELFYDKAHALDLTDHSRPLTYAGGAQPAT